ncbi:hypothetical protein ENHYD8BJ_140117 [Enhydrobacter sp. 8BJ]|nr:hypothetical protein ENHYD8BJ_140117 [Enhydrobacter sp. 8BJ]
MRLTPHYYMVRHRIDGLEKCGLIHAQSMLVRHRIDGLEMPPFVL